MRAKEREQGNTRGKTTTADGGRRIPDTPVIAFIEGDGIGPDIWTATRRVLEAAVGTAYGARRKIQWQEVLAGGKAYKETGEWLSKETLQAIRDSGIAIKGPLTTPVGEGIRSINVVLRQRLGLYACIRPIRHITGVPSPMRHPDRVNMVVFRENTEDVYAGIEWEAQSRGAQRVIAFLKDKMGVDIGKNSAIGIKPNRRPHLPPGYPSEKQ